MSCPRCFGNGTIIICPDDMCRGADECIHGDGEVICTTCHGEGDIGFDEDDRDEEETPPNG